MAIFLASLMALSVTALALAIYCHNNTSLTNVDILNWDRLLSQMSELKYCLHTNMTENTTTSSNITVYSAAMSDVPLKSDLNTGTNPVI